ncbi:universal stress protein [Leptobacterium flavescens]|uniref:Universal stress protein n=1 Tax=Leptobacterium flavescens TaxID=472055 RepID=A0A6P0UVM7_9FLAO|nr:universal stress protein [Leptobacterium flavescens]NER14853.1 universal stress protein [Leptobacterium flavescens]
MKNVLLPTDFSNNAWNAVEYAVQLLKNENCHFFLLNAYTPAIVHSRFFAANAADLSMADAARNTSEKGLQTIKKKILEQYPNKKHRISTLSSFSMLTDAVKEAVVQEDIEMVVMGTKGASGIKEIFMGSNTVNVIKTIKECPVLVIPEHFSYCIPDEIAFATDFTHFYSASELKPLINLVKTFNATLRIVHIQKELKQLNDVQKFNFNTLRKYLKEVEFYVHTITELNSVSKSLEHFSEELHIYLLAMLNYQHSFIEKMTREPIVKRVAFHTQVPLLIIPELSVISEKTLGHNAMENAE